MQRFHYPQLRYSTDALPRLCNAPKCLNDPAPGQIFCVGCQRKIEDRGRLNSGQMNRHNAGGRCYVYAIESVPTGNIKIGRALNVRHRFQALQVSTHEELRERGRVRGTEELETRLLLALADHKIRGEWFKPDPPVLRVVEMIEKKDARGLWLLAADRLYPEELQKAHVPK